MKRPKVALALLLALAGARVPAQGLELDPLEDAILLGVGVPYGGFSEYLVRHQHRDVLGTPDRNDINAFDRLFMASYSPGLNTTGDIAMVATVLLPLTYGFSMGLHEAVTAGVIYAETLAFANGAKNTFKLLVARYRPYVYSGGASGTDPSEADESLVSGDSTLAFAAATASVVLFSNYFPQSRWIVPLAIGSYGFATLTAALRVAAGMHFVTDVAAGAALGTAIGYAVPALHRRAGDRDRGPSLSALPTGLLVTWRY